MKLSTHFLLPLAASAVISASLASGQIKLLPSNGATSHHFGESLAVEGALTLVGSPGIFGDSITGSAYLFNTQSGAELLVLSPSGGSSSDEFGCAVDLSGATAIVGNWRYNGNAGSAYLFNTTSGAQLFQLAPPVGSGARFGESVGISGDTAIVGCRVNVNFGIGQAYLFDTTTGTQQFILRPSDGKSGDYFGRGVAISGSVAVIGAPGADAAYIFDTVTGQELSKLQVADGMVSNTFGQSVAIDGGIAIVGDPCEDNNTGNACAGAAYLFDTNSGALLSTLIPLDADQSDYFGWSVAISGGIAVIGAPGQDISGGDSGGAYTFDTSTGKQLDLFVPSDGFSSDWCGRAVALDGNNAIASSPNDDDLGGDSGSAYIFFSSPPDCNGNGTPDDQDIADGTSDDCNSNGIPDECEIADDPSLDCDDDTVLDSCQIAGNPSLDCDGNMILDTCDIASNPTLDCDLNGQIDSCEIAADPSLDCDGDTVLDFCQIAGDPSLDQDGDGVLDSCQCAFSNFCFSTQNSTGQVGTIGWSGSASISAADLTITGSNLPINQFGIFFYGADEWFKIMGDGVLCIAPPLYRIKTVVTTGPTGTANLTLDYGSQPLASGAGQVTAFSTWRFQLWYRDPTGGPAGSNTTDGLMVTFCP